MQQIRFVLCALLAAFVAGCTNLPGDWEDQFTTFYQTPTYDPLSTESVMDVHLDMIGAQLDAGERVDLVVNDWAELDDYDLALGILGHDTTQLHGILQEHSDIWTRDEGPLAVDVSYFHGTDLVKALARLGLTPTQQAIAHERLSTLPPGYSGKAILNFVFDGWGYGPFSPEATADLYAGDDQIAPGLAAQLGVPTIDSPMIGEGGNILSNGEGIVIFSMKAQLQRQEYNPTGPGGRPMTEQEIIDEFAALFTTPNVIAVPTAHPLDGHSVLDGPLYLVLEDGSVVPVHFPFTVNHGDEFGRWADPHTLFLADLPQEYVRNNIDQLVHDELVYIQDFIAAERDARGLDFEIVLFPDPGLTFDEVTSDDNTWFFLTDFLEPQYHDIDGDGLLEELPTLQDYNPDGGLMASAGTWINYKLTPHLVMTAEIGDDPRNAEVRRLLEQYFPTREVFMHNAHAIHGGGGGDHCITEEWLGLDGF